jgi:hypothetical protein
MNRDLSKPQKLSVRNVESLPPSRIFTDTAEDAMTSEKKTNCLDRNVQKEDNKKSFVTT